MDAYFVCIMNLFNESANMLGTLLQRKFPRPIESTVKSCTGPLRCPVAYSLFDGS